MIQAAKIQSTEEAWDNGTPGAQEEGARIGPKPLQDQTFDSLHTDMRAPKTLSVALGLLEAAILQATPPVVAKYRHAGVLTWKLVHQLEDEIFLEVAQSDKHPATLLRMIRSSPLFQYPKDDRPADFLNSNVVPLALRAIHDEWNRGGITQT